MVVKDYYKILGFDNNKASIDEIKIAYRDLAKKYHPDVNSNNKKAEERFKDIGEAYNILSNSKQKRKYDRLWNYYIGRKKKQNADYKDAKIKDFMELIFGDKKETKQNIKVKGEPQRGEDINTEITATITEAFFGANKEITFKVVDGGSKKINVKIPAGIRNSEKIRLIGLGKEGKNGGKNGDLFIRIKIKDNAGLRLKGIDLYTDLPISPWESALGTTVNLQGIDDTIEIEVPKGIQSGEKIEIENHGYKDGKGGRGKLIVETKIMIPKVMNKKELELFKQLNEISEFNPRKIDTV